MGTGRNGYLSCIRRLRQIVRFHPGIDLRVDGFDIRDEVASMIVESVLWHLHAVDNEPLDTSILVLLR